MSSCMNDSVQATINVMENDEWNKLLARESSEKKNAHGTLNLINLAAVF